MIGNSGVLGGGGIRGESLVLPKTESKTPPPHPQVSIPLWWAAHDTGQPGREDGYLYSATCLGAVPDRLDVG